MSPAVHFAASLALVGSLTACGPGGPSSSGVTILYDSDEHVLSLQYDEPPKFLVFLPLVTHNAQGELEGRLARSWEHWRGTWSPGGTAFFWAGHGRRMCGPWSRTRK